MELTTRTNDDITIVDFVGNFDTNTSPVAEKTLNCLIEGGSLHIVANFSGMEYISSAGLRVLLATTKKLKSAGGNLHICHLNEVALEVFEVSGFITIFSVFKTEEEARSAF